MPGTLLDLIKSYTRWRPNTTDLWADCQSSTGSMAWKLPTDETSLKRELSALARAGQIEEKAGAWHPVETQAASKPNPQKELFA